MNGHNGPSRTEAHEVKLERIETLERQATALQTAARSYSEIADDIDGRGTHGAISDKCAADVSAYCRTRSISCQQAAGKKRVAAAATRAEMTP